MVEDEDEVGEVGDVDEVGEVGEVGERQVQDRGHEAYHCHPLTSTRSVFTSRRYHNL